MRNVTVQSRWLIRLQKCDFFFSTSGTSLQMFAQNSNTPLKMSIFEKQLLCLKEATTDLNFHNQIRLVSQICTYIEKSMNRERVIQEFLSVNLPSAINDVICTQLTILLPSMKLIRHLMEDYHFRTYQFLPIFKNILRALIFVVQSDEIENSQLEFFDIIAILDDLMKR